MVKAGKSIEEPILNRFWHLSQSPREMALTELEYAGMRMLEAFGRWTSQGLASGGGVDITYAEATILHIVRMQDRPKSLTTIARLLNRDDTPNIQYGLRKLSKAGMIAKTRDPARKTFLYSATELGVRVTDAYAEIRREVLVPLTDAIESAEERMQGAADFLQIMTGLYDAAGRVAATYQQDRPNANSRHGAAPARPGGSKASGPSK
ncbi:MAG: winged helix DNA-binding protein [Alphaproteobacteria bacterium]